MRRALFAIAPAVAFVVLAVGTVVSSARGPGGRTGEGADWIWLEQSRITAPRQTRDTAATMSRTDIELVDVFLEAWRDGSLAETDLLDPAAEWVNPPDAIEGGTRTGAEAFVSAGEAVRTAFEDARIDLDRLVEVNERVVGVGTLTGHGRNSGVDIERRMSFICTVVDGRVVRFEWFYGPGEAFEAAERQG